MYDIIDTPCTINPEASEESGFKVEKLQGKIEFRNVNFAYPSRPDKLVLNDISFVIQPGEKVAFVGASGCGKSTIVQLIERYYDANSGTILIDDRDIKEYSITSLRRCIGIVMQEPVLFKRSIYDNILYGKLNATEEEVFEAAKNAYIDDLLKQNQENDKDLSGGQKQRVAIARAVIKKPAILMLDEATSALDKESESIVQEALDNNLSGRTSISIAHRLITIMNSNLIFVVDNGSIIEKGTHQELLEMKGRYFILWITGEKKDKKDKRRSIDEEAEEKNEIVKLFAQ